jgi:hypothetical protein
MTWNLIFVDWVFQGCLDLEGDQENQAQTERQEFQASMLGR